MMFYDMVNLGIEHTNMEKKIIMSLELLSQLEDKVQAALETIELLKMELDEQRQMNTELKENNQGLNEQLEQWGSKVNGLLNRINSEVKSAF
jgi:cell division protein ZapB